MGAATAVTHIILRDATRDGTRDGYPRKTHCGSPGTTEIWPAAIRDQGGICQNCITSMCQMAVR